MESMELMNNTFWNGKKVFITGHTGFKGSWLSLLLTMLGAEVTGYSLKPPTQPSMFELCRVDELIHSITGDIRNLEKLKLAVENASPEIVIHMAAQPLVRDSYLNPVETYTTNVMGTVNLFEAVRSCTSVKAVVNVTTDKCYENKEWIWGYRENETLGGYDPYSNSKACSELVTSAYRNSFFNSQGIALASARAGNVIGGGDWANDRLVPDIIRSLLSRSEVVIRNPNAIRPWQHVLEPLHGYILLAQRLYEEGMNFSEAWNFGPNESDARTVEWIVKELCDVWGSDIGYTIIGDKQLHEANLLKLDCSKAKAHLGWAPRWELETALLKIVEWTKAYDNSEDIRAVSIRQINDYLESLN